MSATKSAVLIAAVPMLVALAAPVHAQLVTHKDMSLPVALTIAQGALEECKTKGYAVSVVVVDRDGINIVALRGDGAGPHTMENARRKAYTALTFKTTSEDFAKRMQGDPVRQQQATLPGVIGIPGGVPVKVGNEVIAGVGLSGSPGVDEPCVRAGLAKVEDQLK